MKRLIYDVQRWYIYQYRRAAGLPLVDRTDDRQRAVADEIFCRLYAGEQPEVPEADRDVNDAAWAKSVHAACDQIVGAKKVANLCRGNAKAAAAATREILDSLPQTQAPGSGPPPNGKTRDAADGLGQVQMQGGGWEGEWKGEEHANERAKSLADRLRDDERLKKIALLAGKFKRIVVEKQRVKVHRGADEVSDVGQGDTIERLLPSELVRFVSPRHRLAAIRDLMERKCLQYEMTSTEVLGRGPLVLCLDKSPSMKGNKDVWASAVALALLDMVHRQHRPFVLLGFNHEVIYRKVVKPGRPLPESALFIPCSGGTDIGKVLDLSLNAVETRKVMSRSDIVVITDGVSSTHTAEWIRQRAADKGVKILGVGIGVGPEALSPWCSEVHCISEADVEGIDDETATKLFGN